MTHDMVVGTCVQYNMYTLVLDYQYTHQFPVIMTHDMVVGTCVQYARTINKLLLPDNKQMISRLYQATEDS